MDIIIITDKGMMHEPILVEDNITAEAVFDSLIEESEVLNFSEEEIEEINRKVFYENRLMEANYLLEHEGKEIVWFTHVEVNGYKNDEEI